jgi:hypothetical protein
MAWSKRATLLKLPRQMACAVIRPNQRSTRLSDEALVGVKCGCKRAWAASPMAHDRRANPQAFGRRGIAQRGQQEVDGAARKPFSALIFDDFEYDLAVGKRGDCVKDDAGICQEFRV